MKFCAFILELHLSQNFCHTQTDSHTDTHADKNFSEIVKSRSGHPKTCKSIKNRKSKICNFQFLMDLQGCPEHDLNISGKSLSVSLFICVFDENVV